MGMSTGALLSKPFGITTKVEHIIPCDTAILLLCKNETEMNTYVHLPWYMHKNTHSYLKQVKVENKLDE